jgi:hypothetical protein
MLFVMVYKCHMPRGLVTVPLAIIDYQLQL